MNSPLQNNQLNTRHLLFLLVISMSVLVNGCANNNYSSQSESQKYEDTLETGSEDLKSDEPVIVVLIPERPLAEEVQPETAETTVETSVPTEVEAVTVTEQPAVPDPVPEPSAPVQTAAPAPPAPVVVEVKDEEIVVQPEPEPEPVVVSSEVTEEVVETEPVETEVTSAEEAASVEPASYSISGSITLITDKASEQAALGEIVAVYYSDTSSAKPDAGSYEIRTQRKRFIPDVRVVPVGSTIHFPNDDDLLHNVFSVSPISEFDFGRYGLNESKNYTFTRSGVALIHCDVHHSMQADILVIDTPWYTRVTQNGEFSISGIPPGPGTLKIWHPQIDELSIPVNVENNVTIGETVEITKPRVPSHLNKVGKPYRRVAT